jgi:hypothetical protein
MPPAIFAPLFRGKRAAEVVDGLAREFARQKKLTGIPDEEALFETFSAYCVASELHLALTAPDDLRKGEPNDRGIDAWAVVVGRRVCTNADEVRAEVEGASTLDVHFIIIQAKHERKFKGDVFDHLAGSILNIFSNGPLIEPNSDHVKDLRECVKLVYADLHKFWATGEPRLPKLTVRYTSLGTFNPKTHRPKIRAAKARLANSQRFGSIDINGVGAHELRVLYGEAESISTASVTLLSHTDLPGPIQGVSRAIFGIMSAKELVDNVLFDRAGKRRPYLYENNMRDFLTATEVNEGIARTLRDPSLRGQFAVLNNGVTILTSQIIPGGVDDSGANGRLGLTDPQIVNGCQTCNVLLGNKDVLDDSVNVAVRIVQSNNRAAIERIIETTNTQNALPVDPGILRDAHRNLELYFFTQPRQLFHERREGQVAPEHFERVVTRPELTRAFCSMWLDEAYSASRHEMLEEKYGQLLYQDDDDPKPYYTAAAVHNRVVLLFGKGIPRTYWTARFHIVAGVKLYLAGDAALPKRQAEADLACKPILDAIWDPDRALEVVRALIPALLKALNAEPGQAKLGYAVRRPTFGAYFKQAVQQLPGARRRVA